MTRSSRNDEATLALEARIQLGLDYLRRECEGYLRQQVTGGEHTGALSLVDLVAKAERPFADRQAVQQATTPEYTALLGMFSDLAQLCRSLLGRRQGDSHRLENLLAAVYSEQARFASLCGDHTTMLQSLAMAAEADPANVDVLNDLGDVARLMGDNKRAADAYGQAHELEPDNVRTLVSMGALYASEGQGRRAEPYLRRALQIDPQARGVHQWLVTALMQMGNYYDEARQLAEKGVEVFPNNDELWATLGSLYRMQGRIEEALNCWHTSLKYDPDNRSALFSLGLYYGEKGQVDEALRHLGRLYQVDAAYAREMCWFDLTSPRPRLARLRDHPEFEKLLQ